MTLESDGNGGVKGYTSELEVSYEKRLVVEYCCPKCGAEFSWLFSKGFPENMLSEIIVCKTNDCSGGASLNKSSKKFVPLEQ